MDFVEAIGAEAYVNGNVGTSTPEETVSWIEYMTATGGALAEERARNGRKEPWKIAFWGIGNELWGCGGRMRAEYRSEEHTSELQSLMRNSYAVFCLQKKHIDIPSTQSQH